MKNFLTDSERSHLRSQHRQERDKRICYRINAVLLADSGWTYKQIANALLLSDEAVRQHILEYISERKLKPENGGSESKLNNAQTEALLLHLENHCYLFAKDIVAYVKNTFGIGYTVAGMTAWLKSHGFSYKKPAVTPGKADKAAQEQWINEYRVLKQNLPSNETICFMDGVHPTHNTMCAYGWIKKGVRREILTNTGRQRLNLSGAFDIRSKQVLIQEDVSLTAESTIRFLKKLEDAYPAVAKIHLFCDNAKIVRYNDFLKSRK